MTWPFENDTSAVVKRISNRSISANKKRNLFTIITIALAAALLLAIMLYGFGTSQATINRTKDTAQIVFTNIAQEQGDKLYEQDQIDWIGEFTLVSTEQVNNSTFYLQYGNAEMFNAQGMTYSGNIPVSANEIMLQKSFLKELGYGTELGQTISIPLASGQTISFILSGIINVEMGDIGSYMGMVSKEYANQQYGGAAPLDYYIGLKNAENMSENEATNYANMLAESLNISDAIRISIRSDYFVTMERGLINSDMYLYLLIGAVTFVGSGIVIYSIFYISVAENIRNYGQLRTIGTTKKQIKKIVYREGKKLARIGIPFGLVLGNLIGYFIIPNGWNWLTSLIMTVIVGIFAFFITMFSIRTPVKKASLVSPIEAIRYTTYQGGAKESNKLHRRISPLSLAKVNLLRNKRKFLLTIISLSIGGVLLVIVSTLMMSYNGVAEVRGKSFPFGEYQLELNENDDISLSQLQAQNIFDDDFNEIAALDGVTGTKRWYSIDAVCSVNGSRVKNVQGYTRDEVSTLEANLLEGTVDYDTLVSQHGVVLLQDRADDGYCSASLGDTVEIELTNANGENVTETFTVMGILSNYQYAGNKNALQCPQL